ncbi:LacI family DNA-binding transcriptional regulator [Neobacillus ginsengisoli]|uniref:LacI family transcriptional regulator n=1 Tax=Neobacillus ginsengisoli TaxID=904295 RepID=A0ABT9Y2W4_9BACI|nr:LacI family DNA-binding transcriptional regulator [Neobacillus ginsengisoli]MDQ0202061.1 LacI family transcriptional regulator [Neobacillus ginsengisoli]
MNSTIKDVARKANVSIATVSRILNNKTGFSEKTKKKVLRVIEELGYQPNALARGLINKNTQTIGVLIPTVSNMFASEILSGIEKHANDLGYSVIVCNTGSIGKRTIDYLQVLSEKRVDGVIIVSEFIYDDYHKILNDMDIPVVLVSTISLEFPIPYVKVDDRHAAFTATNYLIKKGHTKIAMIAGDAKDPLAGKPRIEGFKSALLSSGLQINEDYIIDCQTFSHEDGIKAMEEILQKQLDITAIFASSDELAVGAMSVAYRNGIKIPDQLSIIGYDNTKLAEMIIPSLTTVAQPLFDMGVVAATMLFEIKETGEVIQSRIMSHEIVERETVRSYFS